MQEDGDQEELQLAGEGVEGRISEKEPQVLERLYQQESEDP